MLAYSNTSHETPGNLQISVPLLEGNWRVVEDDQVASRTQLMDVLRDMKGIMLKAHYHFDQDEVCELKMCCPTNIRNTKVHEVFFIPITCQTSTPDGKQSATSFGDLRMGD